MLLRRERAIARAKVWTEYLDHKIALRGKMRDFLDRVLRHYRPAFRSVCPASARSAVVDTHGDVFVRVGPWRWLALRYEWMRNRHEAIGTVLPYKLRQLFLVYKESL